jgi:hypothetical protein
MEPNTFTEVTLRNAVQFLGSKRKRYFASGFKKISCELGDFQLSKERLTASLVLKRGKDCSVKKIGEVIPHLGSIESFTVAMRLLELYLSIQYNLSETEIAKSTIRSIDFKTKPIDHNYENVLGTHVSIREIVWENYYRAKGMFDVVVDNFNFRIELNFENRNRSIGFPYDRFIQTITVNSNQYYNHGYKSTMIDIEKLKLNPKNCSLVAISKVKRPIEINETGIGTSYLDGLTFVDFLSISGQLTQILLYQLDNITREESNNMWVRSLYAEFDTNASQSVVSSKAHLSQFNLVQMGGENWRTATVQLAIGSIKGFAKVCHIINIK